MVDYLKRTLQQRLDQIMELQARLEGLREVRMRENKAALPDVFFFWGGGEGQYGAKVEF